jgi:predicted transglutaminase-like cysteine proteinase
MRHIVAPLAAVLLLMLLPTLSLADVSNRTVRMPIQGSYNAPLGYQLFCLTNPHHCRGGGASEVGYTEDLGRLLQQVNAGINRAIRPRSDRRDTWSIGVSQGDCEEYALAKRAELVRLGVPASAVRIAMATTRSGQGHAVVVVRTDAGDLVLDNLTSSIKNWNETGLRWVAIAGANGRAWQHIN